MVIESMNAPAASGEDTFGRLEERIESWRFMPEKAEGIEVFEETDSEGQERYVLRNPRLDTYLNLDSASHRLWTLIDGTLSSGQLCSRLAESTGEMDFEGVADTLKLLSQEGFLKATIRPLDKLLREKLVTTRGDRARDLLAFLVRGRLALKKPERFFQWLSRYPYRPVVTRAGFFICSILTLIGVAAFVYFVHWGEHRIDLVNERVHGVDVLLVVLLLLFSFFIHECSHGAVATRYGRKITAAGFLIYFGVPVFFVDTTDIVMLDRFKRVNVSLAGPLANGVIAGLLLAPAMFLGDSIPVEILIAVGILNMLYFFLNLLPIYETDGHYIIEDLTRISGLRGKALGFMKGLVLKKYRKGGPWRRDDRIFLFYGTLTVLGTIYLIIVAVELWYAVMRDLVLDIARNPETLGPVIFVIATVLLIQLLRYLRKRARERESRLDALVIKLAGDPAAGATTHGG